MKLIENDPRRGWNLFKCPPSKLQPKGKAQHAKGSFCQELELGRGDSKVDRVRQLNFSPHRVSTNNTM